MERRRQFTFMDMCDRMFTTLAQLCLCIGGDSGGTNLSLLFAHLSFLSDLITFINSLMSKQINVRPTKAFIRCWLGEFDLNSFCALRLDFMTDFRA